MPPAKPTRIDSETPPHREVIHGEALEWLAARGTLLGCSIFTSLPDVSELGLALPAWRAWFIDSVAKVVGALEPRGAAVFYQSDIRHEGLHVDKGQLVEEGAARAGAELLFHKIVCRKPPGTISFGRAGYAHLICVGRGFRFGRPPALPDVIADPGKPLWARGIGVQLCLDVSRMFKTHTQTGVVVDPFCGKGTVLAAANAVGLHAIGVERAARRCREALALRVSAERP